MDTWVVAIFQLLWIMQQWTLAHNFLLESLLSVFGHRLRSGIVGSHGKSMCNFWRAVVLFASTGAPFYIPTSNFGEYQFLHILTKHLLLGFICCFVLFCFLCRVILVGMMGYSVQEQIGEVSNSLPCHYPHTASLSEWTNLLLLMLCCPCGFAVLCNSPCLSHGWDLEAAPRNAGSTKDLGRNWDH